MTDLGLSIERFYDANEVKSNTHSDYYKNKHVKNIDELARLFSVKKEELPYFTPSTVPPAITHSADGNPYTATCNITGMYLKDMSRALYQSLPLNPEIVACFDDHYPLSLSYGDQLAWLNLFSADGEDNPLTGYYTIKGGMERLIDALVNDLQNNSKVTLKTDARVTMVEEQSSSFIISTEKATEQPAKAQKLILACNGCGIEQISWNSKYHRTTALQLLISRTLPAYGIKLFLTYDRAWWEDKGLICGSLFTDQTIQEVTAFGKRGKSENYATLLAAFTYVNTEIFYGLNQKRYPRFVNKAGDIPADLVPSQLMVEYVHQQLKKIFGT